MQPTNLNDYYAPNHYKTDQTDIVKFGAFSLIGLAASLTIQLKPDFNLNSVGRIATTSGFIFCGFKIIQVQRRLDAQARYKEMIESAAVDKVGQRLGHEMAVQTFIDEADCQRYLPQQVQPQPQPQYQQMQPQVEYEEQEQEEYYQPQQAYQPNTNYQEYEGEPQHQGFKPNIRGLAEFNVKRILEEATGIGVLGNSGSGKSCLIQLLASALPDNPILVLDPHADEQDPHYAWKNLIVVNQYEDIVEQLEILLELLTNKDRTPLTIICDEWPAVRAYCKQNKIKTADTFILRYGSEARKFNKLPIFASQSGNVKAMGLEGMGDFLENFSLIRLNKIALKYAQYLPDREIIKRLKQTAYCCLIGDTPYIHPTHGHHERVFKGATPKNLIPLRSKRLTIPLVSSARVLVSTKEPQSQPTEEPDQSVIDVEVREVAEDFDQPQSLAVYESPQKEQLISTSITTLDEAIALAAHKLQNPDSPPLAEGKSKAEVFLLFKALIHHQQGKTNSIKILWGVTRSGTSSKYKRCSEEYDQLLKLIAGNEATDLLFQLSSVSFDKLKDLPYHAGVYFVFNGDTFELYYIGESTDINRRWRPSKTEWTHQQKWRIDKLLADDIPVRIGWIVTENRKQIEANLIAKFSPPWNGC